MLAVPAVIMDAFQLDGEVSTQLWAFSERRVKVGRLGGQQGTLSNSVTCKVRQAAHPKLVGQSTPPKAFALLAKRNATVIHTWGDISHFGERG
jgi:hypothetical protein